MFPKKLLNTIHIISRFISGDRMLQAMPRMVRLYRMIAEKGKPGEVYNVGSGVTYSAQEILDKLCEMAVCSIPVEQDPARMRPMQMFIR